jgi:outer membrane protein assembly factor BamB
VDLRRTTRCCSAVALTVAFSGLAQAQPPSPRPYPEPAAATTRTDRGPLALMPVEPAWTLALNNALTAPPAYDGTLAFFPIEGDRLVAYDVVSGEQKWIVTARPAMQPSAGNGLLFILETATLKALRTNDGSIAWELPLAEPLAVRPVWDNGWLVVSLTSGEFRAYRDSDGEMIWQRDLKSPAHALPALAADRVYVPTVDHRIVALRVDNGELLWERKLGGAPNDILALDDRVYAGSQDKFFYCVMAKDGRVDWKWRTGGDVIGRPIADHRLVYFVSLDNVLRAMNLVSGGQQWMRPLPMRPAWGAVQAGATIVVAGQTPPLRAFNIKDGSPAGTLTSAGLAPDAEVAASPQALEHPVRRVPMVLMSFFDIAKGASAALAVRSVEPAIVPVAALPNLVQIAPVTPTTPPPRP